MTSSLLLGVNIDHVATIRQARGTAYPDPVQAAMLAEQAGADGITLHLREDRRHIQDHDVRRLKEVMLTRMNLEMAVTEEMLAFAEEIRPEHACLVPEKREELTTEGGLDVVGQMAEIKKACERLAGSDIEVSLFIDPDCDQIEASIQCGAPVIELHTGCYADAETDELQQQELERIIKATQFANEKELSVNAGHGLHYENVSKVVGIPDLVELNIGHSIIARAMFVGIPDAVREMKALLKTAELGL